jgi:hypothetical protein
MSASRMLLRPWWAAGIGALAVAGAVVSYTLALRSDHLTQPVLSATLFVWISVSYVLCGLIAWWRRPDSRLGPLMVAAGFVAGLSTWRGRTTRGSGRSGWPSTCFRWCSSCTCSSPSRTAG